MKVAEIIGLLEAAAHPSLQEDYDNAGLLSGNPDWECSGVLCTLDVTPEVVKEAVRKNCNCIVAHHPVIFKGLKRLTGSGYVQNTVIAAIKNDIAIYAAHTNLDNVITGVNAMIADRLGLTNRKILSPRAGTLKKLYTYVPASHLEQVREALFGAGAGNISNYSECSFTTPGVGTFKPGEGSEPFSGSVGRRTEVDEVKLEVIIPAHLETAVTAALRAAHPYEEVAYEVVNLANQHQQTGSGMVGEMKAMAENDFLLLLKRQFGLEMIRHTHLTGKPIQRVAVCGGAGSFLTANALREGADAFVTADIKYHEFFDAEGRLLLCDIGHFESEQFTINLFAEIFLQKFPTFAVLKSEIKTNPVNYFTGK